MHFFQFGFAGNQTYSSASIAVDIVATFTAAQTKMFLLLNDPKTVAFQVLVP